MQRKSIFYVFVILALLISSLPAVTVAATSASPESSAPQAAASVQKAPDAPIVPAQVNLANLVGSQPAGATSSLPYRYRASDAVIAGLKAQSLATGDSANIQTSGDGRAPVPFGVSFDGMDETECCGGNGDVTPPDSDLAAGPNHLIAAVNLSIEVYDKTGTSLTGPVQLASLFGPLGGACASDPFDPTVVYDEEADHWLIGADGAGTHFCEAVSQTGNPIGSWWLYAIPAQPVGGEFHDYPHQGVGDSYIVVGANQFDGAIPGGFEGRVWALDKAVMYAGGALSVVTASTGGIEGTPQPLNLHGWNQGTWPAYGSTHYFITDPYDGCTANIWQWNIPNPPSIISTTDLCAATGVAGGFPVDAPQMGGGAIQANDWRMRGFEYRNGAAWSTDTIACNAGGSVDCVRWHEYNMNSGATLVQAGVYGTQGAYRTFPDLAVNQCGDMAVGYNVLTSQSYPSIYVNGRLNTDPPGALQSETLLKAGEVTFASFDGAPYRWGDYASTAIDPDGMTFWQMGEYSKNIATQSNWGNWIGSWTYPSCGQSAPSISLNKTVGTTPGVCAAGDSVTVTAGTEVYYCYQIQNTGDVALNYHDLVDSELGDILDNFPYALAPGAYSPEVIVPATPMASVTNVGTWTAYSSLAGYVADDTIPYDFQDISGTGTAIPLGDDEVSSAIPMGFGFDYFGSNYSDVYVSSNGFLTVLPGQYNGCCSGQPIPTPGDPDGVIAGWWDDLYPPGGGTIVYQTLGSAPNRVFIVQFTDVPHFSSGNLVTMQFKLFEGSNIIEVHYMAAPSDGSNHSAGIENADGSAGLQYYYGPNPLATPLAVQYAPVETFSASASDTATVNVLIPNIDVDPLSLSSTQPANTTTQQNLDVANTGAGNLMWEITEVEPADAPIGAPAAPTTFERPVITSAKECGQYMGANAGPLPEGFLQYCVPAGRQPAPAIGSPRAPSDTAYSLELTTGSFFSFPLNNFAAQTGHGTQSRPIFAMDFNADATTMYAIDYDTWDFGTLNLNTAAFTVLGSSTPTGGQSWTGLTIDPVTNEAYASSCDISTSAIYSVDLSNGATTLIGTTSDAPCLIDIAIGPDGAMYGHDIVTNSIYRVNRNTGAVTLVGLTGYDGNYAQGMDFDNDDGTLYIFLFDLNSFGTVYGTVDLNTGAVTPLAFAQDLEYEGAVQNTSFCTPQDAPWLSLNPTSGTTAGGASTPVAATFDSTGLAPGVYTAQLCVRSNDPDPGPGNGTNLVLVPVTLTVVEQQPFYCNMPNENFDSGVPPAGWTVVNNAPGGASWGDIASCQPSGNGGNWTGGAGNAACMSPGTVGPPHAYNAELRSPMFSLVGQSSASISYLANYQNWAGNDRLNLDISADGGATWTTLLLWNQDYGAFQNLPGVSAWADLTPYVGMNNLMLRWHYYWDDPLAIGWYAQVDNVGIDCTEVPPTSVTLDNLSAETAQLPAPLAGLPLATLPAAAAAALGAAFVWRRKRD